MNKTNQYARALTVTHPPRFDIPLSLTNGELLHTNKSSRRKIRKLVAKGHVAREALPLSAESNNLLFSYLRPLTEKDITATYRGEPFNLAPLGHAPLGWEKVDTSVEADPSESIATPAPVKKAKKTPAKAKEPKETAKSKTAKKATKTIS